MTATRTELEGPFSLLDEHSSANVSRETLIFDYEVPELFGLIGSRAALWWEKKDAVPLSSPDPGTAVDVALQDVCAELFSRESGFPVIREPSLLWSRNYPWLGAHVTHWYEEKDEWRPLLVATDPDPGTWPTYEKNVLDPMTQAVEEPCLQYKLRHTTQMLVAGAPTGAIAVLNSEGLRDFHWRIFSPVEELCALVLDETTVFLESTTEGSPPEADGTMELRRQLYKIRRFPKEVVLTPEQVEVCLRFEEASAKRQLAEEEESLYRNRLIQAFGDAERVVFPDKKRGYTLTERTRRGYTVPETKYMALAKMGVRSL